MKKLTIEQLEATVGGGRLRTCFIAGGLTAVAVGVGLGAGGFWTAGAVLIAGLSTANYNGCI